VTKVAEETLAFTLAGSGHAKFGDGFGEYAHFNYPFGICVDHVGTLFVADFGNHLIRIVEANGFVRTLAGSGNPGDRDGIQFDSQFNRPSGIAVGPGFLLVADQFNHKIRKISLVHRKPIPVPEAEPDTDVESVNSLEDWYKVYRAEHMSFDSEDTP
jgi:hypothetical protein